MGEIFLEYVGGPDINTGVLIRGRQEGPSQRWPRGNGSGSRSDAMEEGATNRGMRAVSRSWKRHGNRFSPTASRSNAALLKP